MARAKLNFKSLLFCLAYIAFGIFLCIKKGEALNYALIVLGVVFVASGFVDLFVNKDLMGAIIDFIIGALLIVFGAAIAQVVLYVLGGLLIALGVYQLIWGGARGLLAFLINIGTIVLGVALIVAQAATLDWIYLVTGIIFIVEGVIYLFNLK